MSASTCRACASKDLHTVLDLGSVPASDHFPPASTPMTEAESSHPLRMDMCGACGLAQLADDDTETEEPRGVEPQALKDQAADAVDRVVRSGMLRGTTVREFGSPHGGSWLPLLAERGFGEVGSEPADVVIDCFGIMHDADQRGAFQLRSAATKPGGVLLLQFHSLLTVVDTGQWNALHHGHFGYYSLTSLRRQLDAVGMSITASWEFDLYGGTVLVAAVHGSVEPDPRTADILAREAEFGITEPAEVARLQQAAHDQARTLNDWLTTAKTAGRRVHAYGASARAVSFFSLAGVHAGLIASIADASPAKQGRRMPGTDVPIVAPEEVIAADPDDVLLTLPDLLDEVCKQYPQLDGRLRVDPIRQAVPAGKGIR